MSKAHDGADGSGRFRLAIDRDQHTAQIHVATISIHESVRLGRHKQGRRLGMARKLFGNRTVQPTRGSLASFGR